MTMPNFIIIGPGKCGTTSLFYYLSQCPDIYMPSGKETNFFLFENKKLDFKGPGDDELMRTSITSIDDYKNLFAEGSGKKAIGEASPLYIFGEDTPQSIKKHIQDVKIIAILRDPSDRAFSNYMSRKSKGFEPLDNFEDALKEEEQRRQNNWSQMFSYKAQGYYHKLLSRYYDVFDKQQIKVVFFEDLKKDPQALVKDLLTFLEVDTDFEPDVEQVLNASGKPKHPRLFRFVLETYHEKYGLKYIKPFLKLFVSKKFVNNIRRYLMSDKMLTKVYLDSSTRDTLIESYKEDILKLQTLLGRDLSHWLTPK